MASANRIVLESAVSVVAGVIFINLLARREIYYRKPEVGNTAAAAKAQQHTMCHWEE